MRFLRYWPEALPEGYLPPDVRAWNRERERIFQEARKGA